MQIDPAHRIAEQITTRDTALAAFSQLSSTHIEEYTLDDAGQLTAVGGTGSASENYAYDDNGNRTSGGFIVGEHNRLTEDDNYTYQYDSEGNLIQRDAKADNSYTTYQWDHRNRLTALHVYDELGILEQTLTYQYNADDQLVYRNHQHAGSTTPVTEHYTYDGAQRVLKQSALGADESINRYLWQPGTDQPLVDERFSQLGAISAHWAATDHLGSVNQLLDGTGEVVEHREYDSFGAIDEVFKTYGGPYDASQIASDVAFAGQMYDRASEMQYHRARWYDAGIGRFISEDPIQFGGNWYAYAGNNPTLFVDPTGLFPQAAHPLNQLAGGFSSGLLAAPSARLNDAFNFSLTDNGLNRNFGGPALSTIGSTSIVPTFSTATNSISDPLGVNRFNQSLFATSSQEVAFNSVNAAYFNRLANDAIFRNNIERQYFEQDLQFATTQGTPLQAAGAEVTLLADRTINGLYQLGIGLIAEPFNLAGDTISKITGSNSPQQSTTFQVFNSDPNAGFFENFVTGTRTIKDSLASPIVSVLQFAGEPTVANARNVSDTAADVLLALFGGKVTNTLPAKPIPKRPTGGKTPVGGVIDSHSLDDLLTSQRLTNQLNAIPKNGKQVLTQVDTLSNLSAQLGRFGEAVASQITGGFKNFQKFAVNSRNVIPDQVLLQDIATQAVIHAVEVKNVLYQSFTRQLRDLRDLVIGVDGQIDIFLPPQAKVSKPLQKEFNSLESPLTRKDLLPPQQ